MKLVSKIGVLMLMLGVTGVAMESHADVKQVENKDLVPNVQIRKNNSSVVTDSAVIIPNLPAAMDINPFVVGQDQNITGTFDSRNTQDKDTFMLIVNGLGRRIVQYPALPEEEQSEKTEFQIYAMDFVDSTSKKVSILHLKDGEVFDQMDVPLKDIQN